MAFVDADTYTLIEDWKLTVADLQKSAAALAEKKHIPMMRVVAAMFGVVLDLFGMAQMDGPAGTFSEAKRDEFTMAPDPATAGADGKPASNPPGGTARGQGK
jgi:hypothetical protein